MVPQTEATRVFLVHWRAFFSIEIPTRLGKILAIRELHAVPEHVLFLTHPGLRITLQRVGKNLCARAASSGGKCEIFSIVLFHPSVFARTVDMVPNVGFR